MGKWFLAPFLAAFAASAACAQVSVVGGGAATPRIPNGAAVWYGSTTPMNTVGANGDFYFNTNSYCLYGPKVGGNWPATCLTSVNQLGYLAENASNKGMPGGYAPLDANKQLPAANLPTAIPLANLPQIPASQVSGVQPALGFAPENAANRNAANGYAPLDNNRLLPVANLPPVTAVSGTSIPGNGAADQTVVTTAASMGSWTSIPSCPDTGGNHLNYSVVTHGFVCGATGGTAGSVGFGGVGTGTNANALMVSGSLDYSGGGTINANRLSGVALSSLPTGLLKITAGTGAPSGASPADVAATLGFTPENPVNKGAASGYAPLDGGKLVPLVNLPTVPYSQTSGVQAALGFTPENPVNKGTANGYAPLDSSMLVPLANMPTVPYSQTSGVQAALGFAPENPVNKGAASGYAPLDSSKLVPLANLPTVPYSQTSGVQAALGFTPENAANRGAAGGYAPLNGSKLVPLANLPTVPYSQTSGVQAALGFTPENPVCKGAASGYAPLDSNKLVPLVNLPTVPYSQTNGVQAALGFTPENPVNKGAASGYAPLDSGAYLPAANTAAISGDVTKAAGTTAATVTALNGTSLAGLATGLLKNTTGTGAPSIAADGVDFVSPTTLSNGSLAASFTTATTTADISPGGNLNAGGNVSAGYNGVGVAAGTYSSGGSPWGTGTCTLTVTGGGGSGAVFTLAVSGSAPTAGTALTLASAGTGYTAQPTGASLSGSCAGTAVIATTLTPGCVHLADGTTHDMGVCAPSNGFNGLLTLPSAAGTAGQALTATGVNNGTQWTQVAQTGAANTYAAGMKQTVQASGTTAGLRVAGTTSDPSSPSAGDFWFRSDTNNLSFYNGTTTKLLATQDQIPSVPVLSVFGRSGTVAAQSGDYTTAQVTESGNLYFTNARVWSALSAAGPLSFNASSGQFSCPTCLTSNAVSSVFGRTGAVTAQSGDYTVSLIGGTLSGDLSGSLSSPVVAGLQGRPVANMAPGDQQVLTWSASLNNWQPATYTPPVTSIFGRTGAVTAASGDYTVSQIGGTLGGDLSGSLSSPVVGGLQGRTVANMAPGDQQVLTWSTALNKWQPSTYTPPVTSIFGRTGAVTAQSGDYSLSQISGSLGAAQMPALTGDVTNSGLSVTVGKINGKTISLGGNLTTAGAYNTTLTATATTNLTLPANGTLATTAQTMNAILNAWCIGAVSSSAGTYYLIPGGNSGPSCSANSAGAGNPMPYACTVKNLVVSAGTHSGGTSDTVNVYRNGSASGSPSNLACTLAAGATSCSDAADTISFSGGDLWMVSVTIGASDTLGNLRVSFECQ